MLQDILLANIGELDDVLDEELEEDERTGARISVDGQYFILGDADDDEVQGEREKQGDGDAREVEGAEESEA